MTQAEVAKELGVARSMIQVIEARALKKAKESCDRFGITFEQFAHGVDRLDMVSGGAFE